MFERIKAKGIINALLIQLIPLFFILHGYNESFGLIPSSTIIYLFLKYCLITNIVFLISVFFLRDINRSTTFALYILLIFFFFGAFHDSVKKFLSNTFLVSYSFLLPLFFLTTIFTFLWIKKTNKNLGHIVKFFRIVFIAIIIFEIGFYIDKQFVNRPINNLAGNVRPINNIKINAEDQKKPDIFFVVLDGYTSSLCLKEEFNYSNKDLDSLLLKNNFFISKSSKSNYNVTPLSLSSTLNANYLKPNIEKGLVSSEVILQGLETFKNNDLTAFLSKRGYEIINYGCFDLLQAKTTIQPYFYQLFSSQIDNQTFYSRISRDIGWNFKLKNLFTGTFRIPTSYKKSKALLLDRNRYNWEGLLSEMKSTGSKPRFVYAHLILPHEPFFLDSNGKYVSDTAILLNSENKKEGYLNQLKFANHLLKQLIPLVHLNIQHPKVVIVQGDHGYRFYGKETAKDKEFMNLNSYFFSDGDYKYFYDGISPVNSFRVVLNKYFHQSFPLLKDSSIYLINDSSPN